jgi:uncharacterized protein (DUF885 family)
MSFQKLFFIKHSQKMIKSLVIVLFLLIGFFCSGCNLWKKVHYDSSTFDAFSQKIFQTLFSGDDMDINYLFQNPENYGLERGEPSLPTPSVSSASSKLVVNLYFGQIEAYNYDELNDDQKATYLIISDLLDNINSTTSDMSYLSSDYLGSYLGYQAQLPLLLTEYNLRTSTDVKNYLTYLDLIPSTFETYVNFEKQKADAGYGMADFVIDKVIAQCDSVATKLSQNDNFMVTAMNHKIDQCTFLSNEEKADYKQQNVTKVKTSMQEGYAYVRDHLGEIKGRSTNSQGLSHYVGKDGEEIGKQYYQLAFKKATGYDSSIEEAEQYIDSILQETISKMNYYRTLFSTNAKFATEVSNISNGEVTLMDKSATPSSQVEYYLEQLSNNFPSLSVTPTINYKMVDEAMEDYFSPAAYFISAVDEQKEESIFLNPASIYETNADGSKGELKYNYLYTTLAHEGIPGHLYQNVYFKNQDVNVIRKVVRNSGYTEGWATYAEMYSYEYLKGQYLDDTISYLKLSDEFNGALYSRMDMGVNYDGWSQMDLYNFIKKYSSNVSQDSVQAIYEQMVEVPTNCQMYYYTYFHLRDLYSDIKTLQGSNFDEINFHKAILDCGPLPMRYVEEIVRAKFAA